MSVWEILLPAFVMTIIMVFTHVYLGLHVLARGIIFIDLALAQIAALGASLVYLLGKDVDGVEAQLFAFGFTLLAAIAFTGLYKIADKTMREAAIGCVYIVAAALSMVVLSRTGQGMEELKAQFNGNILWVSWNEVLLVAIAYALLVLLHGLYHRRFYALSFDKNSAQRPSIWWEFLFFASFAVVIALAVNVAGIFLVFALLIIPAFSASLLTSSFISRLLLGWSLGLAGCVAGLGLSFSQDLPVGTTVVSVMGVLPLIAAGFCYIRKKGL